MSGSPEQRENHLQVREEPEGRVTIQAWNDDGESIQFDVSPDTALELGYTVVDIARGVDRE